MSRNDEVYKARLHREISGRAALSKDRTINLLKSIQTLQTVVSTDDPRLIHLQDLAGKLFSGIRDLLELEDELSEEIIKLSKEIGR
jgi:hypothetical protein